MKKWIIPLLLCAGPLAAEAVQKPGFWLIKSGEDPTYLKTDSIRIHPKNNNLLIYQRVINITEQDPDIHGTSMVETVYLDCAEKVSILTPESAVVYSQFFGEGKQLFEIPKESMRVEMNVLSPLSILSAAVCRHAGRDYDGNPNALDDMKKELEQMK